MDIQVVGKQGRQFTIIREIGRGGFRSRLSCRGTMPTVICAQAHCPPVDDRLFDFHLNRKSKHGWLGARNLLAILDYGTCAVGTQDGPFAVSEFCQGGDYRRRLAVYAAEGRAIQTIRRRFPPILAGLGTLQYPDCHPLISSLRTYWFREPFLRSGTSALQNLSTKLLEH